MQIGDRLLLGIAWKGSIFSDEELKRFWTNKRYPYIIKMLYNAPFRKRIVRHDLIEKFGLPREDAYWGCFEITNEQFHNIAQAGGVYESFVVNQAGIC